MVGLVQTVHGHMTWLNYHIEASSGPSEEIDKNMVDEDRMILMREDEHVCLFVLIIDTNRLTTHFWSLPRSLRAV